MNFYDLPLTIRQNLDKEKIDYLTKTEHLYNVKDIKKQLIALTVFSFVVVLFFALFLFLSIRILPLFLFSFFILLIFILMIIPVYKNLLNKYKTKEAYFILTPLALSIYYNDKVIKHLWKDFTGVTDIRDVTNTGKGTLLLQKKNLVRNLNENRGPLYANEILEIYQVPNVFDMEKQCIEHIKNVVS